MYALFKLSKAFRFICFFFGVDIFWDPILLLFFADFAWSWRPSDTLRPCRLVEDLSDVRGCYESALAMKVLEGRLETSVLSSTFSSLIVLMRLPCSI